MPLGALGAGESRFNKHISTLRFESFVRLEEYIYFIAGEGYYTLTGSEIASLKIERAIMLKKPKLLQGREKNTSIKSILEK